MIPAGVPAESAGPVEREVLASAAALVAAFGAHDTAAYFDSFAADATFVFYTHPEPLRSRAAYEELWATWEADGFRVVSCESSDRHVQVLGEDLAVFTHRVHTVVRTPGVDGAENGAADAAADAAAEPLDERETIVFRREPDGRWVAVHEHLSPSAVAG